MQTFQPLNSQQTELLALLDTGAIENAERLFKQLSQKDSYTLVLFLYERSKQPSTTVAKQPLPKLPLGAVSRCAERDDEVAEASGPGQDSAGCEHGELFTLSAVGSNISTETPRLDFGGARADSERSITGYQGHQPMADSQALLKQSLAQRVAAAGGYNNKASLDLQLGDSVADFNLLASRLGGFGATKVSLLVPVTDVQTNTRCSASQINECSTAEDNSAHGSSSLQQAANACQSACHGLAAPVSVGLTSDVLDASTCMAFGSSVSSEDVELSIPSCSSSPKEAPSSSKAANQQGINVMRQSAAEMRASALVGPISIKLDDLREGEDTVSEPTTPGSTVSATATMLHPLGTATLAPVSAGAPGSNLSTPSTVGSSVSQHRQVGVPAADINRHNSGLGRVLFAPVSALRKSLTGKRMPKQPLSAIAGGISSSKEPAAATTYTSSRHCAGAAGRPQSRLPSFSATAGHTASSSRTAGNLGTPSNGYHPPSSASDASARTPSSAASKSPLGQGPDRAAAPSPAGLGSRAQPSGVLKRAARSRLPGGSAIQKSALKGAGTSTSSSSCVSAGLAWLQQHDDPMTQPPAVPSIKTPASASRTGSRPVGHTAAAEAAAAVGRAVGLKSAPVSPANSRPGTSHSVRSVASAAPHTGSSSVHQTSRVGAGAGSSASGSTSSSRIPGFSVTEQMVAGKQQRSTPPSSARTAPTGSARSAKSAATLTTAASFMRQIAGMNSAAGAAGAGRTASRLPTGDIRQLQTAHPHVGPGISIGKDAAAQGHKAAMGSVTAVAAATTGTSSRRAGSRIGSGAVRGSGSGAANGTSQLRRSRSFGSLSDLQQQTSHQDVSQIRQMWQRRAAAQFQQQQQPYEQQQQQLPRGNTSSPSNNTTASVTGPVGSGFSRIPVMSAVRHAEEAAVVGALAGKLEPEECESPTALKQQRRSSSSGHDTSTGGAATHVPASDLLGRIDDIIQKARTPTGRLTPAHQHTLPAGALTAAGYQASAAAAAATEGFSSKSGRAPVGESDKVAVFEGPGSDLDRYLSYTSQAAHAPAGGALHEMQPLQYPVPMDSSSAGRDQQLGSLSATEAGSISRQLF